jgi:hypothetical protein
MRYRPGTILEYQPPRPLRAERPPAPAAAFVGGWLAGLPVGGLAIMCLLGGAGILVPAICVATAVAGLPAMGVFMLFSRWIIVGNAAAFSVAIIGSVLSSFGLLAAFALSFHGC